MANDDIAQTEDEAKRRGYRPIPNNLMSILPEGMHTAIRRPCTGPGQLCLQTNCRPDNTLTVCYCDANGNCGNCYVTPCGG